MTLGTVAIVGSGLIGRSWAITFARAGWQVRLSDPDPDAGREAIGFVRVVAGDLEANDLLGGRGIEEVVGAITPAESLDEALERADWVQECGPEKVAVKAALFLEIDRKAPEGAILASSSSALLPSAIFEIVDNKARCLVAHPINPPYLVPAVELVPHPSTSGETMDQAREIMEAIGQVPIVMKREIDGFIMNRLQGALLQEAFRLVANGYASAEDVDRGIADGLALRWSFMGPFETIDLNAPGGVEDYAARFEEMYAGLFEGMRERVPWSGETMRHIVESRRAKTRQDELAARQIWRDRRLMALRAHKTRSDRDIGQ